MNRGKNHTDYSEILDSEIQRSLSVSSLASGFTHIDENRNVYVDEFKLLKLAETMEKNALDIRLYCQKMLSKQFNSRPRKKKIPRYVSENIFTITLVWQLLCVAALEIVDVIGNQFEKKEKQFYIAGVIIMVIFQFSNLILSLAVTVKLTKQYMHQTASMKFLLQSYAATILLFAGMYTFVAKVMPDSFQGIRGERKSKIYALILFSQLLFTSISTGTLCGSSSVTAIHLVTEILMSFQMLLSFIYFASILSQVISPSQKKSQQQLCDELINKNNGVVMSVQQPNTSCSRTRSGSCETI